MSQGPALIFIVSVCTKPAPTSQKKKKFSLKFLGLGGGGHFWAPTFKILYSFHALKM